MTNAIDDRDGEEPAGVEFLREDDGTITARHVESGRAHGGQNREAALAGLEEVIDLHEGRGEPIEDPDVFLREAFGIDEWNRDGDLPEVMR